PPEQTTLGTGDTQVTDRITQHRHDFVPEAFGPDEVRVSLNVAQEPLLVFAHAKEVILFFDQFRLGKVVGTLAVTQLFRSVKPFTANAVKSPIAVEVDIASVVNFGQEFLDIADMIGVCRADKVIVGDITGVPGSTEGRADAIGKRLGGHLCIG